MTDQNAYVNAYIENAMNMVHEQVNIIMQQKTQLKLVDALVAQKDATIADLNNKLLNDQNSETEMNNLREKARIAEDSYHTLTNKVSHMETLQNQFNDIKRKYIEVEKELAATKEELKNEKESVKMVAEALPKKRINKKESAALEFADSVVLQKESNDF
jgi:uncharacterized protein involved in exopolysaccharide biosynthesis